MAIAVGNTSNKQHENTIVPSTNSHTVNSGANRILIAIVTEMNFDTATTLTYNSTAMTKLLDETSGTRHMSLWYMLETDLPAGGAYNFSYNNGTRAYGQLYAICFSNVAQTAPYVTDSDTTGAGQTTIALSLPGLKNGDAIVYGASTTRGSGTSNTWSPAADYTEWFDAANDGLPLGLPASSTGIRRIVAASGNYTPSSTSTGTGTIYGVAVAMKPSFRPRIIMQM